jgi:glycosyltransferase involved in cell wall biosynthesis
MKVLLASASGIYLNDQARAIKNNSGFSHMMRDISEMLSNEGSDVEVVSQSIFTSIRQIDSWTLLRKTWWDLAFSIKPFYIIRALKVMVASNERISYKVRILLYFLTGAYVERIIKKNKPDILHIHGITEGSLPYIYACARTETPYVVTLHGLLSFNKTTNATDFSRSLERQFLMFAAKKNINLSVVSTGIKNRVNQWLGNDFNNIKVICNPVKRGQFYELDDTEERNKKLILCVGNINERKNQKMVLNAYELVKHDFKNVGLVFVGGGSKKNELEKYCKDNMIKDVTFTGSIDRTSVNQYYMRANLLVTASIDEGFGLPIIEAYSYGVPAVTFDDIDAIPDVYTRDSMILVHERTIEAFAYGIVQALNRNWDKTKIIEKASRFSFRNIGRKYDQLLKNSMSNVISTVDVDNIFAESIKNIGL